MKLESTIRDRAGLLHLAPMLDTVMLLLMFVLIGGSFVLHSGFEVDVPVSNSVLPVQANAHVVTISPDTGAGSRIMFNGTEVTMKELDTSLKQGRSESRQVILRGDRLAYWGVGVGIMALANDYGYDVMISTGSGTAPRS